MNADPLGRDFFFRIPHTRRPTQSFAAITVQQEPGGGWRMAYEYDVCVCGVGTPYEHSAVYPSRESAGRNGMLFLRDELRRFARGRERGPQTRKFAAALAERINESVLPQQFELDFG